MMISDWDDALAGTSRGTAKVNCPLHLGARGERRNALPFLPGKSGPRGRMAWTMEARLFFWGFRRQGRTATGRQAVKGAAPARGGDFFCATLQKKYYPGS